MMCGRACRVTIAWTFAFAYEASAGGLSLRIGNCNVPEGGLRPTSGGDVFKEMRERFGVG